MTDVQRFIWALTDAVKPGGAYIDDNGMGTQIIEDAGTGTPDGHSHTISEEADHTHTVATLPPYVVLWALMRKYP